MVRSAKLAVLALGIASIVLALYNVVTPGRNYLYLLGRLSGTPQVLLAVPNGGPAQAAGLRTGDVLDIAKTTLSQRIDIFAAAAKGTLSVPVVRAGNPRVVDVSIQEAWPSPSRFFDLALVVIEVVFGFIVMLRAGHLPLARMVVWLAVAEEIGTVGADFQAVGPTPVLAFTVGMVFQLFVQAATTMFALMAVAQLPAGMRRARVALLWLSPILGMLSTLDPVLFGSIISVFAPASPLAYVEVLNVGAVVTSLSLMVLVVAIALSSPVEHRARSMWFVSTIAFCWLLGAAIGSATPLWFGEQQWLIGLVYYFLLSCTLIGPIYATLRHRVVDLNLVISRSTAFAAISMLMLGGFIGVEWLAGKLADGILEEGLWRGVFTQAVSFSAAIFMGIYLRSFHAKIERWVNSVLFREQNRRLSLLESFGREADLVQTRSELLLATFEALRESLDTDEIAIFTNVGGNLILVHASNPSTPALLERSDRVVLQLCERHRPFVSEVKSLRGCTIVPLSVRRDLVGAIICGRKRDRTEYLPEETRILLYVAQHVATSYALLPPVLPGSASMSSGQALKPGTRPG
ncbi:MAG TPA: GAF domain-containing protein [Candidatus Baltobacteraceae bacterium]|jgi:hypothetical protein